MYLNGILEFIEKDRETAKETQVYRTVFWTLWEKGGGNDLGEWH